VSRGWLGSLALSVFLLGAALSSAAPEQDRPTDPRIIEANALLAERSGYARAIELYEAVLADDPEDSVARRWAAKVEAWRGNYEESLAHFAALVDRANPPADAEVERAEVLSWAGRYDDARVAFERILAADPENVRAHLGLARSYRWSQRPGLARESYERALALAEDPEAARELEALEARLAWSLGTDAQYYADSDGFQMFEWGAESRFDFDFEKGIFARVGHVRARRGDGFFAQPNSRARDTAVEVALGGEVLFHRSFRARLEAGARIWEQAGTRAIVHGELEYDVDTQTSVGLDLLYSDALGFTQSLQAVDAGITGTNLRSWVWRGWTPRIESYSYLDATFLGAPGKNERVGVGSNASYRLLENHDLRATLAVDYQHFARDSVYYYSPEHDFGAAAGLAGSQPVFAGLSFRADASIGGGVTEDLGVLSAGVLYRVGAGLVYDYDGWAFSTNAFASQSIRDSAYTAWGVGLNLVKGF